MKINIREAALDVGFSLLVFLLIALVCMLSSGNVEDFTYVAF